MTECVTDLDVVTYKDLFDSWAIERYGKRTARQPSFRETANCPAVILDTGGIIDIEKRNGKNGLADFILSCPEEMKVLVTGGVMGECNVHNRVIIGKKREISDYALEIVRELYKGSLPFFSEISSCDGDDFLRYCSYWIARETEQEGLGSVSRVDEAMLWRAIQMNALANAGNKFLPDSVVIASPDNHLKRMVELAKREGYNGIQVFRTR